VTIRFGEAGKHPETHITEDFEARSYETTEFAWLSHEADTSKLEVVLEWSELAGRGTSIGQIPNLQKNGKIIFKAPSAWQAVVVEIGSTDDINWVRIQDLVWATKQDIKFAMGTEAIQAPDPSPSQLRLGLSLAQVGVSLVSLQEGRELMYAELRQIGLLLGIWEDSQSIEGIVSDVQIDCQLLDLNAVPVVFVNRGEGKQPCMRFKVLQRLPASNYLLSFQTLALSTDKLEVCINNTFICKAIKAIEDLMLPIVDSGGIGKEQLDTWKANPLGGDFAMPPPQEPQISVDQFVFMGLHINIWASMDLLQLPKSARRILKPLLVGSSSIAIEGAYIDLEPEVFEGITGDIKKVAKTLLQRYFVNIVFCLGSALGHCSPLALPTMPVSWVRRGLVFGMGGIDFALTHASDVVEMLALDTRYVCRKKVEHEHALAEIRTLRAGISTAAIHVALGLWHLTDIVRKPIIGACEDGFSGFVTGVGEGIVGTAVKPVMEVTFSARAIMKAIRSRVAPGTAVEQRVNTRRRPPRVMYGSSSIRRYDEVAALLTVELRTAKIADSCSRKAREALEQAIMKYGITDHMVVNRTGAMPFLRTLLLLLTPIHLLLVDLDAGVINVRWALALANYRTARASSHGVVVYCRADSSRNCHFGSSALQIPCENAKTIQAICRMLRPLSPLDAVR